MNIGTSYLDSEFIKECGEASLKFKTLTPIGTQKTIWPQILTIALLFPTIISGAIGYGKPTKDSKKKPFSKTSKTIFKIIFWVSLVCLISMGSFSAFSYIMYLIDYNKWYNSLSGKCRNDLFAINNIKSAINLLKIN